MSDPSTNAPPKPASTLLTGGSGFDFEDYVAASYLVSMLMEGGARGLGQYVATTVAIQRAASGAPSDDVIVTGQAPSGDTATLHLQAKSTLRIGEGTSNAAFRDVVERAWKTVTGQGFQRDKDRVGAAVGAIGRSRLKAIRRLQEIALQSSDFADFAARFDAVANAETKDVKNAFDAVVKSIDPAASDEAIWMFFKHFVTLEFDVMGEGAHHIHDAVERLRFALAPEETHRATDLWLRLVQVAKEVGDAGGSISRDGLLTRLSDFKLAPARSVRPDLFRLTAMSDATLADIRLDIGGLRVSRQRTSDAVFEALGKARFVQIRGEAGTGKSAILRELAEFVRIDGFAAVLGAKRIEGSSWTTFATANGLTSASAKALLSEIAASSSPTLFIDGIDRITDKAAQQVVRDILQPIIEDPACANWRVVATARDENIEYLRTWLPPAFLSALQSIEVKAFDDKEAEFVARTHSALRPLLFGDEALRSVARRPFFLSVLVHQVGGSGSTSAPRSEVELIDLWWSRGGYDAIHADALRRQQHLRTLAERGLPDFGRSIDVQSLDANTLQALIDDRVLRVREPGFTVSFAHDIFFEWALYQTTRARGANWIDLVRSAGEPPFFGRVVSLLSQRAFEKQEHWKEGLEALEAANARSQWRRAWLIAPFSSPLFPTLTSVLDDAILNNPDRLRRLILGFQSEKTQPNPLVLAGLGAQQADPLANLRLADQLAWPSDPAAWRRFLAWLLPKCPTLPEGLIASAVAAFGVWVNTFAHLPQLIQPEIGQTLLAWLNRIEAYRHPEDVRTILTRDHSSGLGAISDDELRALEQTLRMNFLIATRAHPDQQRGYLDSLSSNERVRQTAFREIIQQASLIGQGALPSLVDLTLSEVLDLLPEKQLEEDNRRGAFGSSSHDEFRWRELSLDRTHYSFNPASPAREPFQTLFMQAPDQALRLVRALSNHATEAWRQLQRLDRRQPATPIPTKIKFPWGEQEFWGDARVYYFFRGGFAPDVLASGLMALEQWAHEAVKKGRPVDEILQALLADNQCVAVLGIAVAVALEAEHVSPATLSLIASSRVWDYDVQRAAADLDPHHNETGFNLRASPRLHQSLKALNEKAARGHDMRTLAMMAVLSKDQALSSAAKAAITALPTTPHFDYEEQTKNDELKAQLLKEAEGWAKFADVSHYRAWKTENPDKVAITFEAPEAKDPAVVARAEEAGTTLSWVNLARWTDLVLKDGLSAASWLTLPAAIEFAKRGDVAEMFSAAKNKEELIDLKRAALAGVAAVVIQEIPDTTSVDIDWAVAVLHKATEAPRVPDETTHHASYLINHGDIAAARGLARLIDRGLDAEWARETLLGLILHPLDAIFEVAVANGLQRWDKDPALAWTALKLGMALSFEYRDRNNDWKDRAATEARLQAEQRGKLAQAIAQLKAVPFAFTEPETPAPVSVKDEDNEPRSWEEDPPARLELIFRSDLAARVIKHAPIEHLLQHAEARPLLLAFADKLLAWTISRHASPTGSRRDRPTPPFEWTHSFMGWLARLSAALPGQEALDRYMKPMLQLRDDECFELLQTFADQYVCRTIHDAPTVDPGAVAALMAMAARISSARWTYDRGKVDGSLTREKHELAKAMLFVNVEQANGAARFANGNWKDIPIVLPVVEELLNGAGAATGVFNYYLTLCERASAHYPAEAMADTLFTLVDQQKDKPAALHSISAPERIAALVQSLAAREQPLSDALRGKLLRLLDLLVELGDRRSAALLASEWFRTTRRS